MTIATVILLPIVLAYTAWAYRLLRGPVTAQDIEADPHMTYCRSGRMWYFSWVLGLSSPPHSLR
jgi:hypothetical protein